MQKKLCRFLVEQGVYAEGTKFGPFETDLLASVRAMATVIEVKRYRATTRPTVKTLRANLAQLQDYMDKRTARPTGALVVYNFTPTLVVAPNRWIRGRYWICIVNLGKATGSARRSTLGARTQMSDVEVTQLRQQGDRLRSEIDRLVQALATSTDAQTARRPSSKPSPRASSASQRWKHV